MYGAIESSWIVIRSKFILLMKNSLHAIILELVHQIHRIGYVENFAIFRCGMKSFERQTPSEIIHIRVLHTSSLYIKYWWQKSMWDTPMIIMEHPHMLLKSFIWHTDRMCGIQFCINHNQSTSPRIARVRVQANTGKYFCFENVQMSDAKLFKI